MSTATVTAKAKIAKSTSLEATQDSTNISANPNTNYDAYANNLSTDYGWSYSGESKFVLEFALTGIPTTATIISASVRLYCFYVNSAPVPVSFYKNTAQFLESTVTWNTTPGVNAVATALTSVTAAATAFTWNVAADITSATLLLGWVGWTAREGLTTNDNTRFNDHENTHGDGAANTPKLIILWTDGLTSTQTCTAKAAIKQSSTKTVTAKGHIIPAGTHYHNIDIQALVLDDYARQDDDGVLTLQSIVVGITSAGLVFNSGIRFLNVQLPNNAGIVTATIEPYVNGGSANTLTDYCRKKLRAELVNDSAAFADVEGQRVNERARTVAGTDWDDTYQDWITHQGQFYKAPEMKAVIQELLDKTNKTTGDDLVIFLDEDGSTAYYATDFIDASTSASYATKLHITYYELPGTTQKISAKARILAPVSITVSAKGHIRKNWMPDVAFTYQTTYIWNMNASGNKVGWKFTYSGPASPVTKVGIYVYDGGVGTSPTYRIGLQSLDVNGMPSGTWLGATAHGYVDGTLNDSQAWQEFTLGETVTLANGTDYAIVVEYVSGTINSSNYRQVIYGTFDYGVFSSVRPLFMPANFDEKQPNWLSLGNTGGGWWNQGNHYGPIFYVTTSAGSSWGPGVPRTSNLAIYGATWYGTKFKAREIGTITNIGAYLVKWGTPADNLYYKILDVDNANAVLASGTFCAQAAVAQTTAHWLYATLASPLNLVKGHTYALIFNSPSSANSSNCYGFPCYYTMGPTGTFPADCSLYYSTNSGASYSTYTNYLPEVRIEYISVTPSQTVTARAYIQPPGKIQRRIVASYDDAFDYADAAYTVALATANNTRQGHRDPAGTFGDCTAGYRFQSIAIPRGAVINSAYFHGNAYFTEAFTVAVRIYGVDADNESDFGTTAPSDKSPLTTNYVDWTIATCTADDDQASGDIKTIIQEIVDRLNWQSGNAIELIIFNNGATVNDNRSFKTWDYCELNASKLYPYIVIDFTELNLSTQTITAKASIGGGSTQSTQTVTVKGDIKLSTTQTVTAKGRTQLPGSQNITAKANIKVSTTKTLTVKGRIQQSTITKTLTAKARIQLFTTRTLTAKANIYNANTKTVTALGNRFPKGNWLTNTRSDWLELPHGCIAQESDGTIHVVTNAWSGSYWLIYHFYSVDGGLTWTEECVTPTGTAGQYAPKIAIDSNDTLHVVWEGIGWGTQTTKKNIKYIQKPKGGSWSAIEHITDDADEQFVPNIYIAPDDTIHIVWYGLGYGTNTTKYQVAYSYGTSGNWSAPTNLTDVAYNQWEPKVVVDSNGDAHVIWHGLGYSSTITTDVLYRRQEAGVWQAAEQITNYFNNWQQSPSVTIDADDNLHLVWSGYGWDTYTGLPNIQYKKRTAATDTWEARETVNDINAAQGNPVISVDVNGNVYVVWEGRGYGTYHSTTDYDIIGRKRTAAGVWGAITEITDNPNTQLAPGSFSSQQKKINGITPNTPKNGMLFVWISYAGQGLTYLVRTAEVFGYEKAPSARAVTAKARIQIINTVTITAKGNVISAIISATQTITAKGRIQIGSTQTITAKARLTVTTSRNVVAKARIQTSQTRTLTAKGSILRIGVDRTIQSKARISASASQTITSKGRIQISSTITISAKARIGSASIQTITAKGRITQSAIQTITAKASVMRNTTQTITGKADIKSSTTQTVNAKGRVQLALGKTITAKASIFKVETITVSAKGRIQWSRTQTLTSKARITIGSQQTITAKTRIQSGAVITVNSKARIQRTESITLTAKGRIQIASTRTITAKGSIFVANTKTITAKARIQLSREITVQALANILATISQTITAKASISKSTTQTTTSKGDVLKHQWTVYANDFQGETLGVGVPSDGWTDIHSGEPNNWSIVDEAGSRCLRVEADYGSQGYFYLLKNTFIPEDPYEVQTDIYIVAPYNHCGLLFGWQSYDHFIKFMYDYQYQYFRLEEKYQSGGTKWTTVFTTSIVLSLGTWYQFRVSVSGNDVYGYYRVRGSDTWLSAGHITTVQGTKGLVGVGTQNWTPPTVLFDNFWAGRNQLIAKASIYNSVSQTVTSLGRIEYQSTQTISAKARIKIGNEQNIDAKGDIAKQGEQTLTAKASILRTTTQTVETKGRIQISSETSITAKARIEIFSTQTIEAKASIFETNEATVTAIGNIKATINLASADSFEFYALEAPPPGWTKDSGTWLVKSFEGHNTLHVARGIYGSSTDFNIIKNDQPVDNRYEYEIEVSLQFKTNDDFAGLIFGWKNSGSFCRVRLNPFWNHIRVEYPGGSFEPIVGAIVIDTWYRLRIVVGPAHFHVYYKALTDPSYTTVGTYVIGDGTDLRATYGYAGLSTGGDTPPETYFDDFWVSHGGLDAKANIRSVISKTVTAKSCVVNQVSQSVEAKARIETHRTETITAKGNIFNQTLRTIRAKGRITVPGTQQIDGKANIRVTTIQTLTALGRISRTESGTIEAKANIVGIVTQSVTAKADIFAHQTLGIYDQFEWVAATYPKGGFPANWFVYNAWDRDVYAFTGLGTPSRTGQGLQYWSHPAGQTDHYAIREDTFLKAPYEVECTVIFGSNNDWGGLIIGFVNTGQHCRIRLSPYYDKMQISDGNGNTWEDAVGSISTLNWYRIRVVVTETGFSVYYRHLNTSTWTFVRTVTTTKTQGYVGISTGGYTPPNTLFDDFWVNRGLVTAKARITATQTKTVTAKARIKVLAVAQTVTAQGDIYNTNTRTILAKGRVRLPSEQTIDAKGSILNQLTKTISAKGSIHLNVEHTITALARIEVLRTKTITAVGRITQVATQAISAKADIKATCGGIVYMLNEDGSYILNEDGTKIVDYDFRIAAKANILATQTQILTAKGNIVGLVTQTIEALGRIGTISEQTITTKARIQVPHIDTVTALANIKVTTIQSIEAKASIFKIGSQLITAKANVEQTIFAGELTAKGRITQSAIKTITALGRIEINSIKTITAKGRIELAGSRSITAKANIRNTFTKTVNAKARIEFQSSRTIQSKGRIEISSSQTITAKGRVSIGSTQIISAKARIQIGSTRTINAKTRIEIASSRTITAKGRITQSTTQTVITRGRIEKQAQSTIQAKARITIFSIQTFNTKANIKGNITRNITTRGRILVPGGQTIEALGDIKKETTQNIIAKGSIHVLETKTITSKARITITTLQSILARGNIVNSLTRTISAKARITATSSQVINAKARIEKQTGQTIQTRGRVEIFSNQTISAKAAIQHTFVKTINAKARITITSIQTVNSKADIKATLSRTVLAKGRITTAEGQNIEAKANIKATITKSVQAKASIAKLATRIVNALGRITATSEQSLISKGNIVNTLSKTIIAKARITNTYEQSIQAKGSIGQLFGKTITAKGRIELTSIKIINAKASIFKEAEQTVITKARINVVINRTVTAKASIFKLSTQVINAKGRIGTSIGKTIEAKARITQHASQTVITKARITISTQRTITAKASIFKSTTRTILAKAAIKKFVTRTILAKASIKKLTSKTLIAKGNIRTQIIVRVLAKGRIQKSPIKTVTAKGRITIFSSKTVTSKANIVANSTRSISVKGNIKKTFSHTVIANAIIEKKNDKTIQAKGNIVRLIEKTIFAKARIQTVTVIEIIDKVRVQEIIKEITYIKEKSRDISYNKVHVINIIEPKTQQIKWVTAKGYIINT